MLSYDQLKETIAAEKQQFEDYKASVNQQLSDKDNTISQQAEQIADLQIQLVNAGIPDEAATLVQDIVNP